MHNFHIVIHMTVIPISYTLHLQNKLKFLYIFILNNLKSNINEPPFLCSRWVNIHAYSSLPTLLRKFNHTLIQLRIHTTSTSKYPFAYSLPYTRPPNGVPQIREKEVREAVRALLKSLDEDNGRLFPGHSHSSIRDTCEQQRRQQQPTL